MVFFKKIIQLLKNLWRYIVYSNSAMSKEGGSPHPPSLPQLKTGEWSWLHCLRSSATRWDVITCLNNKMRHAWGWQWCAHFLPHGFSNGAHFKQFGWEGLMHFKLHKVFGVEDILFICTCSSWMLKTVLISSLSRCNQMRLLPASLVTVLTGEYCVWNNNS